MSSYDYLIIVHPDEDDGGFWTEVPPLPGCGSQGETLELAVEMTKDAIQRIYRIDEEARRGASYRTYGRYQGDCCSLTSTEEDF